jgi:hypothetical protein
MNKTKAIILRMVRILKVVSISPIKGFRGVMARINIKF